MRARVKATFTILFFLLIHILSSSPISAGAPTDQIRSTVEKAQAVLRNERLRSEAKVKERREQLRQVISARFDFTEMAKRSLGAQWRRLNAKQQEEFVQLFADLLERSYIDRIESYNNEKFAYHREKLDGNFAEVESRLITRKGEEFSLNYKLHLVGAEWKAYDVVAENVSLVNNYRSQFNRIITNSSYEELVRRMREKQIEMVGDKKNR